MAGTLNPDPGVKVKAKAPHRTSNPANPRGRRRHCPTCLAGCVRDRAHGNPETGAQDPRLRRGNRRTGARSPRAGGTPPAGTGRVRLAGGRGRNRNGTAVRLQDARRVVSGLRTGRLPGRLHAMAGGGRRLGRSEGQGRHGLRVPHRPATGGAHLDAPDVLGRLEGGRQLLLERPRGRPRAAAGHHLLPQQPLVALRGRSGPVPGGALRGNPGALGAPSGPARSHRLGRGSTGSSTWCRSTSRR